MGKVRQKGVPAEAESRRDRAENCGLLINTRKVFEHGLEFIRDLTTSQFPDFNAFRVNL